MLYKAYQMIKKNQTEDLFNKEIFHITNEQ